MQLNATNPRCIEVHNRAAAHLFPRACVRRVSFSRSAKSYSLGRRFTCSFVARQFFNNRRQKDTIESGKTLSNFEKKKKNAQYFSSIKLYYNGNKARIYRLFILPCRFIILRKLFLNRGAAFDSHALFGDGDAKCARRRSPRREFAIDTRGQRLFFMRCARF